mgnify:CR=1 FL=1
MRSILWEQLAVLTSLPNKFRYSFLVQNFVSGSDYKVVFWAHSTKDMDISIAFTSSDGKRLLAQKNIGYVDDESETYLVCKNCLNGIFTEVKILTASSFLQAEIVKFYSKLEQTRVSFNSNWYWSLWEIVTDFNTKRHLLDRPSLCDAIWYLQG